MEHMGVFVVNLQVGPGSVAEYGNTVEVAHQHDGLRQLGHCHPALPNAFNQLLKRNKDTLETQVSFATFS